MPGRFDPEKYVTVNVRIQRFYEKFPGGSLQCEIEMLTTGTNPDEIKEWVHARAFAYRTDDDPRPGVGNAAEEMGTKEGSEFEIAETSAWGRALAALGFEVAVGIASREDMQRAVERDSDADLPTYDPDALPPKDNANPRGEAVTARAQEAAARVTEQRDERVEVRVGEIRTQWEKLKEVPAGSNDLTQFHLADRRLPAPPADGPTMQWVASWTLANDLTAEEWAMEILDYMHDRVGA